MANQFHFMIGGAAGEGIMVTGLMLAKFASRSGYQAFDFVDYPSLIRGGHNAYYGTIGTEEVFSTHNQVDLLIALNQETISLHQGQLTPQAGIIYDPDKFNQETIEQVNLFPVPLDKLAQQAGHQLMANTVALGAMIALTGGSLDIFNSVLADAFKDKKPEVVQGNQKAAWLGFDFTNQQFKPWRKTLTARHETRKMVIAGNEAMALGALAAGLKFAAIYPMTPISSILTSLAAWEKETGIVLRQPEDEIAGINMAIGASFAGVRSLVATSGGGFALMNEALSLAGITETPVVVIFGQRSGPATGLPTCTGQEDLLYALNAAHGEYPRILLAPGDARECFYLTAQAFNLADIYQTPVVILVDKLVCEAHQTVVPFNFEEVKIDRGKIAAGLTTTKAETEIFPRYQVTADGISPRIFPGQGKIVKGNSDEHNEFGFSDEMGENRVRQMEKRQQKLTQLDKTLPSPPLYGPEEADLTLVGWGSVKGPILEAMSNFKPPAGGQRPNEKVNFLHLNWLRPFPAEAVKESLSKAKRLLLVENNYQGQLGDWIRMQTGIEIKEKFLKYNGHQFYPEEIADKIKEMF